MKRLLALLLLVVSPAFAQQYTPGPYLQPPVSGETENLIYTTLNTPPDGAQFTWTGFINTASQGGGVSGGNVPGYNSSTGTFLFGYTFGTVTYRLTNTSEYPIAGTEIDSFKYSWEYFNQDFSRGSLTANIKFYDPNNSILENYNFQLGQTTSGWTLFSGQIDFASPYNISDLAKIEISFTGKDDRFWAGYYGPQVRDLDLSLVYTSAPPPTDFPYWDRLAGENELFTLTEPGVVRYGANGVYIYAEFQPGTYACTNGDWGNDPIGGVVKSCDFGSNIPPPVAVVDCTVDPYDETCIIDSVTSDETYFASEETGSDDGSDDGSDYFEQSADEEEKLLADEESSGEELFDEIIESPVDSEETDLEEMLADEEELDEEVETVLVANKEIANEEKASTLSDSIAKNTLEAALSIASAAETAGSTAGANETQSTASSTKTASAGESQTITAESVASIDLSTETIKEENASLESALELLETGRLIGRDALETTLALADSSATESVSVAESVAAVSAETSTAFAVAESVAVVEETTTNQETQFVVANENEQNNPTDKATEIVTEQTEMVVDNVQTDQSSAVSYSDIESVMEVFASNLPNQIAIGEQEELENNIIQQSIAATQTQQEETNTFGEAEAVTIASDPNLAAAFNMAPNMMNLEITGVLNNKQEEKSDAEKRADEVVAANAKEQEEINKNYMEADQSGIVAAMGADTDVGAYRTAMIRDNNNWYKPEDIYKNIVYKDNVRGSYFLEKANTDTYKKMVEEQYK